METQLVVCKNCSRTFSVEPEDFAFYEKMKVPPPTWCPACRLMRRFLFRNERHIFRRRDSRTGQNIFSGIPEGAPTKVWDLEYWNSDAWDPLEYGRPYDFSRPFFEQFKELLYSVPWPSKSVLRMVESPYCDQASDMKNCYLAFNGSYLENSAYTLGSSHIKESFDMYGCWNCQLSYENVQVDDSYKAAFSYDCEHCTDIWLCRDMVGCTNCIGCVGLRKKSYHILNKPVSKEEYDRTIIDMLSNPKKLEDMRIQAHALWEKFPLKYMHGWHNTNCTGEMIQDSKNVKYSYHVHGGENMKYCQMVEDKISDSYDYTVWGMTSSQMYEVLTCGEQCNKLKFCWECWPGCRELEYSAFCRSSSNLFGCVGVKKKQYCIFNVQYSKEEYEALREKIIAHMHQMTYTSAKNQTFGYGEFFPPEFSPFSYNQTAANDYFPLTKEEAEGAGYAWREADAREYHTTLAAQNLPENVRDAKDSIIQEVIACERCTKAYRIIPMELQFLRQMGIPLPRLCPECRFARRFSLVNPPKFEQSSCSCTGYTNTTKTYNNQSLHRHGEGACKNTFFTSYRNDKKNLLYCEQCYQDETA